MTRVLIKNLTEATAVADADELPIYSDDADATRKASLATVKTFLTAGVDTIVDDAIAAIASPFALTLLDDTTAAAFLTTLGVSTFAQTILDDTSAGAALTTLGVSAFARTILDDADASAARTTLGLVIGTDVQAQDAELSAIAGLASVADRVPYFTGTGTAALAGLSSYGRTLTALADAAAGRTALGLFVYRYQIDDLIERLKDFLADLGYDLVESEIDDDADEPDLYALLVAEEAD